MTDIAEAMLAAIADLKSTVERRFAAVDDRLAALETAAGRANAELAQIRGVLAPMRAQLDGLPLLNRSITTMHQDLRSLRAAFNDFARTNVTAGEVEALHSDVNRVQAENAELAAKIATLERMISELAELKSPPSHPGASPTRPSAGNVIE